MLMQNKQTREWVWVDRIKGGKVYFTYLQHNLDGTHAPMEAVADATDFDRAHRLVLAEEIAELRYMVDQKVKTHQERELEKELSLRSAR